MHTRSFHNTHMAAASSSLLSPTMPMSSYAAPFPDVTVPVANPEWPAEAIADLHRLGKGLSWALGIEGAAAIGIYVTWHLVRLWL